MNETIKTLAQFKTIQIIRAGMKSVMYFPTSVKRRKEKKINGIGFFLDLGQFERNSFSTAFKYPSKNDKLFGFYFLSFY